MTQFDPNMVAQMLMQPVGKESLDNSIADENFFQPIEIPSPMVAPLDMQGGFFISPETAGKIAYGGAVAGASFVPGAGIVDAAGGAVDVTGQPLPSFGQNIRQGNYLDAALQGLGVAGDVATFAAPATLGTSAVLGAMLKAPGAIRKTTNVADVASDIGSIAKVEPPTETKPGIIAFHGSGADFDEFKLDKIGTGEGNQAFGYGLYFADSEDIADFYKKSLSPNSLTVKGKEILIGARFGDLRTEISKALDKKIYEIPNKIFRTVDKSIETNKSPLQVLNENHKENLKTIEQNLKTLTNDDALKAERLAKQNAINEFENNKKLLQEFDIKLNQQQGKTFKVGIEAKPENLLDYDKPIGQQNEFVTERLKKVVEEINADDAINLGFDPFELGEKQAIEKAKQNMLDPDRTVVSFLNDWAVFRGEQATGEKLLDKNGIKGIKFLDNSARNTFGGELLSVDKTADGQFRAKVVLDDPNRQTGLGGSGRTITTSKPYKTEKEARDWADKSIGKESNNYVIFDDKLVKIMEKYGIVGPVAVSAMAGALKDDDGTL